MGHPDVSPVGCFNVTNVGKCRANKVRISAGHWRLVHTSRFRKKRGSFDSPSNISNPINDHCFGAEIASHVLPPLYLTPCFLLDRLDFYPVVPLHFRKTTKLSFRFVYNSSSLSSCTRRALPLKVVSNGGKKMPNSKKTPTDRLEQTPDPQLPVCEGNPFILQFKVSILCSRGLLEFS